MPRIKLKKCKQCPKEFQPRSSLQVVCSAECAIKFNSKKESDKRHKELRKELKHPNYIELLQVVFNTYIRTRDKGQICISCPAPLTSKHDAGHYWTVKGYSGIRFDEDNVHAQCVSCNQHKDGAQAEYEIGLRNKIGDERFEALKARRHQELKLSIPEIKDLIKVYKGKIKELLTSRAE